MKRAYYSNNIHDFLLEPDSSILGELTANHSNRTLEELQINAWCKQIKILILVLISVITLCTGCDSNDDNNSQPELNGEYIGIFERNGNTSNVELNFNNGIYSGESETEKFPAICNGVYSISSNSIQFQNGCFWTADFDWTLILSDEWNYEWNGNTLILTKSNGDLYTLTKQ